MNHLAPLLAQSDAGLLKTLLTDFSPSDRLVLLIVLIGTTTVTVLTLGITSLVMWDAHRKRELEMELKRDLLDQGKSAEEIERILRPADGFSRSMEKWWCGKKR